MRPRERPSLADWIELLPAEGRHTFTSSEADAIRGASASARRRVLARLIRQHRLISPRRGFYVIVPPEHRDTAAVPPTWYLDEMMRHLGESYYVGLLSAAALHGAAHQQPQRLQVVTEHRVQPTSVEAGRIAWVTKKTAPATPVEKRRVATGYLLVSTPEATACDLVQYVSRSGGLGNVATVLVDLAPRLDPAALAKAADAAAGVAVIQRLGYLLELLSPDETRAAAATLESWLRRQPHWPTPLRHERPTRGASIAERWGVLVNEHVRPDVIREGSDAGGSGEHDQSWDEWLEEVEWGDAPHSNDGPPNNSGDMPGGDSD